MKYELSQWYVNEKGKLVFSYFNGQRAKIFALLMDKLNRGEIFL